MSKQWFDVDRTGLGKQAEQHGKGRLVGELIQNALDEEGVTRIDVSLALVPGRPLADLTVEDDSPEGFRDLAHAYTLFAESYKRSNPEHWGRWLNRSGHDRFSMPDDEQFVVTRKVRTGLGGWRWSSFTKTQYASDPRCGGIPNFLRSHVGVVTLLDRIAALPTMSVEINDEGKFGPSTYSDDWREARAEGREPTYVWHPGKYDVKALALEVGDWNEMIAGFSGALKDALGGSGICVDSAIGGFPNFEQLEFRGSQDARIQPFLAAMRSIADKNKESDAA